MYKEYEFDSKRLIYRGIKKEDAPILVQWRSDPEIIRYFLNPTPLGLDEHLKWFEEYQNDKTRYDFLVIHKEGFKEIGFIGVNHIQDHSCFINYTIADRAYRKHGYASEAVVALCECFHRQEGMNLFLSNVHKENVPSQGLMNRLDFIKQRESGLFITFEKILLD